MADKRGKDIKNDKAGTGQRIDISQAVNRTITLPSALVPAKPPKGSKWYRPHSFSNVGLPAPEESSRKSRNTGQLVEPDIDRPVNQTITLPSALKPAKPPKGSKWENRPDPSIREQAKD